MRSMKTLIAALALTALALNAQASPGGLDQYGGHTEKATGQYHFHQLNGKKLSEPLPGVDPDKNGGKISYTGTPKFSGEEASEKKAPAAKMEKAEKKEKAEAREEKAEKPAKKSKKAKKEKAEAAEPKAEKKEVKAPKAKKEKAEPAAEKAEKPAKKTKKAKKEKAAK